MTRSLRRLLRSRPQGRGQGVPSPRNQGEGHGSDVEPGSATVRDSRRMGRGTCRWWWQEGRCKPVSTAAIRTRWFHGRWQRGPDAIGRCVGQSGDAYVIPEVATMHRVSRQCSSVGRAAVPHADSRTALTRIVAWQFAKVGTYSSCWTLAWRCSACRSIRGTADTGRPVPPGHSRTA